MEGRGERGRPNLGRVRGFARESLRREQKERFFLGAAVVEREKEKEEMS